MCLIRNGQGLHNDECTPSHERVLCMMLKEAEFVGSLLLPEGSFRVPAIEMISASNSNQHKKVVRLIPLV